MSDTTAFNNIDNLITVIRNADEPASVTNNMVAQVMDTLNDRSKYNTLQVNDLDERVGTNSTDISSLTTALSTKAPLGSDGRVPAEYLPEAVVAAAGDCRVCAFAGAVDDVEPQEGEATYKSTDNLCAVVYDTVKARLLLRRLVRKLPLPPLSSEEERGTRDELRGTSEEAQAVSTMSLGGLEGGEVVLPVDPDPANPKPTDFFDTYYYGRWADDASFGSPSTSGCTPVKGRAYVDTSEATIWLWDGSALKAAAGGEVERITEDEIDQLFQ